MEFPLQIRPVHLGWRGELTLTLRGPERPDSERLVSRTSDIFGWPESPKNLYYSGYPQTTSDDWAIIQIHSRIFQNGGKNCTSRLLRSLSQLWQKKYFMMSYNGRRLCTEWWCFGESGTKGPMANLNHPRTSSIPIQERVCVCQWMGRKMSWAIKRRERAMYGARRW